MPKRKSKVLTVFSRNSYKGRLKGVLPAFLPNRCEDLTAIERTMIREIEQDLKDLLVTMDRRK